MKKLYYPLILILTASISMTSCKKDSNKINNEFTFEGSTIGLDVGYIKQYGINDDSTSYDIDVNLVTEGISYSAQAIISGVGDYIYLDLNSPDILGLAEGTYVWSKERADFTIVFGDATLNADVMLGTGQLIELSSGSIEVSFDGDETILELDLISKDDKPLTGYFKGVLQKR